MLESVLLLAVLFTFLVIINVPIAFAILLATTATLLLSIDSLPTFITIAQRMVGGLNSFALLAIPLFVLSGLLMGQGGIAARLINFAKALIGMLPGGLAFVNVISCMLFGSISGSAVATTSAIGSFMLPEMNKAGYKTEFNAAITATGATTGMLIPPSNVLIVYAIAAGGVSISALFLAGYLPGILLGLGLMLVCAGYAKKHNFPRGERVSLTVASKAAVEAIPSLMMIVIIIGGITSGIFTATEAGAVAVIYATLLSVFIYKEVDFTQLVDILRKSAEVTAVVMLLVGASMAMSWMLAYENIPQSISQMLLSLTENPLIILLIINITLLVVGAFLDVTPAILIFTPIFLPVAVDLGMSPIHFGIMIVLNLSIGLCTPPVGSVLFVSCAVAKTSITKLIKPLVPLYLTMIAVLLLVTYVPEISLLLPSLLAS